MGEVMRLTLWWKKTNSKYKNVMRGQGSECHRLQVKC